MLIQFFQTIKKENYTTKQVYFAIQYLGSYEEYLETEQFNAAYEFFRQMYKKVELQDIEDFSK